jgi:hypothetical protein
MTPQGSFYPLRRDARGDHPVMFAYILDAREHREALGDEIIDPLGAIQELSEIIATAQFECADSRSHSGSSKPWPSFRAMCAGCWKPVRSRGRRLVPCRGGAAPLRRSPSGLIFSHV